MVMYLIMMRLIISVLCRLLLMRRLVLMICHLPSGNVLITILKSFSLLFWTKPIAMRQSRLVWSSRIRLLHLLLSRSRIRLLTILRMCEFVPLLLFSECVNSCHYLYSLSNEIVYKCKNIYNNLMIFN